MYYNILHPAIPDRCTEVFTRLRQMTVTTAMTAAKPLEVLLCCEQGEEFSQGAQRGKTVFLL
jgi:hypothetical protein